MPDDEGLARLASADDAYAVQPLVLAALPEHHAVYRDVSHNAHLLPDAIAGNPDAFSPEELRQKAWAIVEPRYTARLQGFMDEYGAGLPRGLASDALSEVAMAALGGRVRTLLVDDDRVVPGRVDRTTAHVSHGELDDPHVDDILYDLTEIVLRMGGDVVMVPRDRMPSITGIFRSSNTTSGIVVFRSSSSSFPFSASPTYCS